MRPFFIGLSIALGFNINPMVLAQVVGKKLQGIIHDQNLNKADIQELINLLFSTGRISQAQAKNSMGKLLEMTENEIKSLTMEALTNLSERSPLFADEVADSESASGKVYRELPTSPFLKSQEIEYDLQAEQDKRKLKEVQEKIIRANNPKKTFLN